LSYAKSLVPTFVVPDHRVTKSNSFRFVHPNSIVAVVLPFANDRPVSRFARSNVLVSVPPLLSVTVVRFPAPSYPNVCVNPNGPATELARFNASYPIA
jgi:hypothetical protein